MNFQIDIEKSGGTIYDRSDPSKSITYFFTFQDKGKCMVEVIIFKGSRFNIQKIKSYKKSNGQFATPKNREKLINILTRFLVGKWWDQ